MELFGGCGTCMKQELTTEEFRLLHCAGPYRNVHFFFTNLPPTLFQPQPHPIDPSRWEQRDQTCQPVTDAHSAVQRYPVILDIPP